MQVENSQHSEPYILSGLLVSYPVKQMNETLNIINMILVVQNCSTLDEKHGSHL